MLKRYIPAVVLGLSFQSSLSWAQLKCADILYAPVVVQKNAMAVENSLSRKITKFMDLLGAGNTTSLRQEDKFVVSAMTVDTALSELAKTYGDKFQLRDTKQEGRKNVTVTQYALPFKWTDHKGKKISAKIRFRKYYDTDASVALGKAEARPAEFVKDRQFVEMKIDHPIYDQVVIKPRVLMMDTDATMVQNRAHFLEHKHAILQRTLALNPKTSPEVVRQFFDILSEVYSEPIQTLPLFAKTAYVRDSYSVMLKDLEEKPVEIQLTVDREINVKDSRSEDVVVAYNAEDVVVELKIPLSYSHLSPADIVKVHGLDGILALKNHLDKNHFKARFAPGSGKLSTFVGVQEQKEKQQTLELLGD